MPSLSLNIKRCHFFHSHIACLPMLSVALGGVAMGMDRTTLQYASLDQAYQLSGFQQSAVNTQPPQHVATHLSSRLKNAHHPYAARLSYAGTSFDRYTRPSYRTPIRHGSPRILSIEQGFPTPDPVPALSGVLSNYAYTNPNRIPIQDEALRNRYVRAVLEKHSTDHPFARILSQCARSVGVLCVDRNKKLSALGTGTLIDGNKFLIAKHCLDGNSNFMVRLGFIEDQSGAIYHISKIQQDPSNDLAILTLNGSIDSSYESARVDSNELQPYGPHFIIHHAGGHPMQVSSGEFTDDGSDCCRNYHHLIVDGGPIASGAGVWNGEGCLIGVCVSRNTSNGVLARDVILLSQSKLFTRHPQPTSFWPHHDSEHRLNATRFIGQDPLYSDALEGRYTSEQLMQVTQVDARRTNQEEHWLGLRKNAKDHFLRQLRSSWETSQPHKLFSDDFYKKHILDPGAPGSNNDRVRLAANARDYAPGIKHYSSVFLDGLDNWHQELRHIVFSVLTAEDLNVRWIDNQLRCDVRNGPFLLRQTKWAKTVEVEICGRGNRVCDMSPIFNKSCDHVALEADNNDVVICHPCFNQ